MSQWFYTKGDQQHGPFTTEKLKELAATGVLASTDLVWREGMTEWVPARKLKGLFPAASPSTAPPPLVQAPSIQTVPQAVPTPTRLKPNFRSLMTPKRMGIAAAVLTSIVVVCVVLGLSSGHSKSGAESGADDAQASGSDSGGPTSSKHWGLGSGIRLTDEQKKSDDYERGYDSGVHFAGNFPDQLSEAQLSQIRKTVLRERSIRDELIQSNGVENSLLQIGVCDGEEEAFAKRGIHF